MLVGEHGIHCEGECNENNAIHCEEIDEITEEHLLYHNGKPASNRKGKGTHYMMLGNVFALTD